MSRLNELIQKLCPDGVEYRPLEKCCNILDSKRKPITKSLREAGKYPYYGANGIQDYVSGYIFEGTFVLVGEDGSVMTSNGNPVVTWAEGKIWVNNHAHIISEVDGVLLRFLYHYIQTVNVSNLIHGNIPKLSGKDFKAFEVPVPPLEVQREIVRVLDNYTEKKNALNEKLSEELDARRKQYEYYRDELLTFEDDLPKEKLGTLCKIGDGLHSTPMYDDSGEFYFINGNNLKGGHVQFDAKTKRVNAMEYEKYKVALDKNTILMSINGTIGKVAYYHNENVILGKSVAFFIPKTELLSYRFLYHLLQSGSSRKYYKEHLTGNAILNLGLKALREFKVPIPDMSVQIMLADHLDAFEQMCNDFNIVLLAEVETRQKQYEDYRDKLLTFKRKD